MNRLIIPLPAQPQPPMQYVPGKHDRHSKIDISVIELWKPFEVWCGVLLTTLACYAYPRLSSTSC
jgi:hypothetical protein